MKTLQDFQKYYEDNILPQLKTLEEKRKAIVQSSPIQQPSFSRYLPLIFAGGILLFMFFYIGGAIVYIILPPEWTGWLAIIDKWGYLFVPLIIISFILWVTLSAARQNKIKAIMKGSEGYKKDFKNSVVEKIIHFIDKDLNYSIDKYIPESVFAESKIFLTKPVRYSGEDYISGVIGKTRIEFSEVSAEYEIMRKGKKVLVPLFKGVLFVADFNKNFSSKTIVLPDTSENLFGNMLGSMMQSWKNEHGELVKLEDPEFEKFFVVYSNDQIEGRYILSTSLMKRLVDFKKRLLGIENSVAEINSFILSTIFKLGGGIYLSFVGSKMYIALPNQNTNVRRMIREQKESKTKFFPSETDNIGSYLEPPIFGTALDIKPIQDYFEDLQLIIGIVEDLNLNTRIWSK